MIYSLSEANRGRKLSFATGDSRGVIELVPQPFGAADFLVSALFGFIPGYVVQLAVKLPNVKKRDCDE